MQQKNSVALFEPAQTDSSALWRQNNKKQADALNHFWFFLKKGATSKSTHTEQRSKSSSQQQLPTRAVSYLAALAQSAKQLTICILFIIFVNFWLF